MDAGNRLVSSKEALEITGISRTSQWRLTKRGVFPRARQIPGTTKIGYLYSELIAWIESLPVAETEGEEGVSEGGISAQKGEM